MEATPRVRVTGLRDALQAQGRTARWVAGQAAINETLLSHAMKGRRTIPQDAAERISTLIGVPFAMLFELPSGTDVLPVEQGEAA